ncbi:L-rhamnose mutarotase [Spirosoma sp. HMF4905]|uniref:L-rhamnose mutarotase n=1 Tax=Spirosoma arboris TaxID=2682092 RepID=A0A7K1SNH7_9BACT|nr:L-rhamnose mutarotase [Spirosoma arboris]MVM35317.1 L-rhamnose mutarotase [Spirosoma arboris]
MQRFCLSLDLKDDPDLIAEYERWHARGSGWPEVRANDLKAGILDLQIYRTGNRMFMILETDDQFTFEKKAALDLLSPHVQEWERLMWTFQQPLPWAKEGEKWVLMDQIFQFEK